MPRKQIQISTELPYHITARCINREWFAIPMNNVWEIMEDYLYFIHHVYEIEIISFVLMNNHFHLIVRTPKANLSKAMNYFMRETSRRIGKEAGRINQVYSSRFHRCLMTTHHHFLHAYKYVYRNPVEANIVSDILEYPYSTLAGLLGKKKLIIPVGYDETLFSSLDETINWLNLVPSPEKHEEVRKALRRRVFELPKDPNSGKLSVLEKDHY